MSTIRLKVDVMGLGVHVIADNANPYDDGYLLNRREAIEILDAWKSRPTGQDPTGAPYWVREYEYLDGFGFATALWGDGELNISSWESTTEHHSMFHGTQVDEGEDVYSTDMWPFDFEVVEITEDER